jgi:GTP cyclohydrolase II
MMIREKAQPPLKTVPKAIGVVDIRCLSSAPRRSLVQLVSQGLACAHRIANLQVTTINPAHYREQNHEL